MWSPIAPFNWLNIGFPVTKDSFLDKFERLYSEEGDWDLKVPLREKFGDHKPLRTPVGGDPAPEMLFYDVWGNIHFGYVGRAHGVPADILHAGAEWKGGARTASDWLANEIGIRLWDTHGAGLTKSQLAAAILANMKGFRSDPAGEFHEVRGGLMTWAPAP
jgi:hypothetical protein